MKLESIGGGLGRIKEKISHTIIEYGGAMLTGTARQEFEEGRLQAVGKILTKRVNFTAESTAATRPEFQENRHRLNTKPGLIIANHPGKLDPFLLLSQIERTDLLVMVDTPVYAALVRELGPDIAQKQFVSNKSSRANLKNVLHRVNEHIDQGGAFLVFPAGGGTEFQSTFGRILQNRKADDMVYSFHLDPEDVGHGERNKATLLASIGFQVVMPQSVPSPREMTAPSVIKLDEHFSTVEEWQNVMKGASTEGKKTDKINASLTDHFAMQFILQRMPEAVRNGSEELQQEYIEWEKFMAEQEAKMTFLERAQAPGTTKIIVEGRSNPETYENFTIAKEVFTDDPFIWIATVGIGGIAQSHDERTGTILGMPKGLPGKMDVIPRFGTVYMIHGPTAIAGYTPEQCIAATENVLQAVDAIVDHHPDAGIGTFSFSAGTHFGPNVATHLGRDRGRPVDKAILLAPGESIALGIYRTPVTKALARSLYERGIGMKEYDRKIAPYTQRENIEWMPGGRNLVIHAGDRDTFIPKSAPGGTDDLVERLRAAGKNPTYVVHKGVDHITLPLSLIMQQNWGMDPYRLANPRSVWDDETSLRDEKLLSRVDDEILSRFTEQQLEAMQYVLTYKDNYHYLSRYEEAIDAAIRQSGVYPLFRMPPLGLPKPIMPSTGAPARGRMRREGARNVREAVRALKAMDKDEHLSTPEAGPLVQHVDLFGEVGKLNLPQDQYALLVDGPLEVAESKVSKHIRLLVSETLFEGLKRQGWKEGHASDIRFSDERKLRNGDLVATRATREFQSEDFPTARWEVTLNNTRSLIEQIEGVPVLFMRDKDRASPEKVEELEVAE
ncbi:MAG TPA: 1-acyl-sn-glycerol-3-phosphate acyltransferase [Candidatus Paceibacterota bacterium]